MSAVDYPYADLRDYLAELDHPIARVIRSGEPVHGSELSLERGDGRRIVLSVNVAPLQEAAGAPASVVVSASDGINTAVQAFTWTIDVNGVQKRQTFTIFVPAYSMNQQAIPAGVYGDLAVSMKSDGFGFWWSAYVTSVDNRTGDGWVSHVNQK